jgi:hypothetical protein
MSEDFKPREQSESEEMADETTTDSGARDDKLNTSVIYNIMDFYECALAHTLGTRRFSTHTEEGVPVQSSCVARDACDSKPHMVVMLHYDGQLLSDILSAIGGMILILSANTSDHKHAREHVQEQDRARIMFVDMTQFARCAPIRPEHSALEMFHYISTEMAYAQESSERTRVQLDAHNFVLGLRLLSETTSVAHIIDDIIADWRRAMDPSEMVMLGRAHAIQIQSMIRARSDLARIINIDIDIALLAPACAREDMGASEDTPPPPTRAPTLVEVKLFLCQDLIDYAHTICAGQSDTTMTYSVRSSNLEYVLTCSGAHAREVVNIAIDGESESNQIIEGTTSTADGCARIQTWTARATHAQMCAFVRETVRS